MKGSPAAGYPKHISLRLRMMRALFGTRIYLAGGCVRDMLTGNHVSDTDAALRMPFDDAERRLKRAGIDYRRSGGDHGGFTMMIGGTPVEITCTREDIACDGRHAHIRYTDSLAKDALRRDFTVNALYMDVSGRVIDFVGGVHDIRRGVLRFVGDPNVRCKEDVLRVWRYARFSATLPFIRRVHIPSFQACMAYGDSAADLPAERIAQECLKLYAGVRRFHVLARLRGHPTLSQRSGAILLHGLDTPDAADILTRCYHAARMLCNIADNNALRIFSVMAIALPPTANSIASLLALPKKERTRYSHILSFAAEDGTVTHTALATLLDSSRPEDALLLIIGAAMRTTAYSNIEHALNRASMHISAVRRMRASIGAFPLNAHDVITMANEPRDIGIILQKMRDVWRASEFTFSRETLLEYAKTLSKPSSGSAI